MISVIVCTYNRSQHLSRALYSLQAMTIPDDLLWELIIVDNNSTDDTRYVVKHYMGKSNMPIRYTRGINQGLAHARNKGVSESKGEIIAFTDDDCIVDRNWLTNISYEFHSGSLLHGLIGHVELYNLQDKQISIRTYREKTYLFSPYDIIKYTICVIWFLKNGL